MEKRKATGSFGDIDKIQEEIRKSKEKAQSKESDQQEKQEYKDSESIPEDVVEEVEKETSEVEEDAEDKELDSEEIAQEIEKKLGITLTEDDLWKLYMGILEKSEIHIIPNKVHVTFKTLSLDENDKLDEAMKDAVERRLLDNGVYNIKARKTLSFCLVGIGKPGKIKTLPDDPEERFKALGTMNTLMIEKFLRAWNQFIWLVNYRMSEDETLKN